MTHAALIPEMARAHRQALRRSAVGSRLVELARCCRPSRAAAILRAYRARARSSATVACCA